MDIVDCCKRVCPCDAVCLLENVLVDLSVGRFVTSYKVGEETFSIARPSIDDVRNLLDFFQKKCNLSKGQPSRRRANVCFVFGNHECRTCGYKTCRCR